MPIVANFITGSGTSTNLLGAVSNVQIVPASEKVYIKWTDSIDVVISGVTIEEWKGTLLVRKAGSVPRNHRDGTIVVDNTVRNAYSENFFCDSGLSNGVDYYYKFFPYTIANVYGEHEGNEFTATPNPIPPNSVRDVSASIGSREVYLTWNDPDDVMVDNTVISEWAGTMVVYKTDRYPTSVDDGTLVINSTTKNAYQNTQLTIGGLTNDTTYYITLFPYSTDGEVNTSELNRITATPRRFELPEIPSQTGTLVYSGDVQYPTWSYYNSEEMTLIGETSGTDAGAYHVTFTPTEDYCWPDGSTNSVQVTWTIERASISSIPTQDGILTYNGNQQEPIWNDYDADKMTIGGTAIETNAGYYNATFTPTSNYCWSDNSTDAKTAMWTIGKANGSVTLSTKSVTLNNDSATSTITAEWLGNGELSAVSDNTSVATVSVSGNIITISGVDKTNGNTTIAVTVSEGDNYFSASDTISVAASFLIPITTVPSQSGSLTYSGSAQSPSWNDYDTSKMTISGTTSGVNAGSYTAKFTPTGNYCWSDESTSFKSVTWEIGKAAGSLSISPTSMTLNDSNTSGTITVTRSGDGAVSATSSNTSMATVSVSGTTVTVKKVSGASGSATITVKVAAGTNHTAPSNKTCSVTVSSLPAVGTALNNCSWTDIRAISDAGLASSYFSVGDRKAVALSGTVGSLSLSGTYYCYIIGINHNSSREGTNRIHFQFGYSGGVYLAFVDSSYDSRPDYGNFFYMNSDLTIVGGWKSSYMRNTICPAFKSVMPSDMQSVLKTVTKYSDNTGDRTDTASNITATSDEIFLLAEYEVYGTRTYANTAERNYQAQYAWYSSGNSKVRYRHNDTSSAVIWWLRSIDVTTSYNFCNVDLAGLIYSTVCFVSYGFTPAFCV